MDTRVDQALARLNTILPLKSRQQECSAEVKALHQNILRSFVDRGRILDREEMAQQVGKLDEAINALQSRDLVVFSADGEPVGAYPFTMETREHRVEVNGHRVHAMCALDALAISPMFGMDTRISSQCRVSGDALHITQSGQTIENPGEAGDIHFGIIWAAANSDSCCADSLCMEMMFLKDTDTARDWLAASPANREIFTLEQAVGFAARFFVPLMD